MDSFGLQFKDLCDKLGIDRDVHVAKSNGQKVGLSVHALRHTAITIANTAQNANVINTALMAGHTAIRTENIYTHQTLDSMKSIQKPSEVALKLLKKVLNIQKPLSQRKDEQAILANGVSDTRIRELHHLRRC